jgi:pyrroloquinoline quinone (PQQ) biosynthesis protein C
MREAAARFAAAGRDGLARWAAEKAREEQGHDALALRDLRDLGYDAEALVRAVVPEAQARLVRFFERLVRADDPVGCVGYSYALERLALEIGPDEIARVEAALSPGVNATRCLRVHSAAGSDREHVRETVDLVATLSPDERSRVAAAAHETAILCHARYEGEPHDEVTLARLFLPFNRSRDEKRRTS